MLVLETSERQQPGLGDNKLPPKQIKGSFSVHGRQIDVCVKTVWKEDPGLHCTDL